MTIYNFDIDDNYFQMNRIVNSSKFSFLKGFSITERRVLRKMFLQLKMDILSGSNQELDPRIKKDLEKQLKAFDRFYKNFRRTRAYNSRRETRIFERCLRKSLRYYSFLILIWEDNEILRKKNSKKKILRSMRILLLTYFSFYER